MRVLLCVRVILCGSIVPLTASAQPDALWSARLYVNDSTTPISPTVHAATELAEGGFVLVGDANPSANSSDAFAARITAQGAVTWYHTMGSPGSDEIATAVVQTHDGNLTVVGHGGSGINSNLVMIWGYHQAVTLSSAAPTARRAGHKATTPVSCRTATWPPQASGSGRICNTPISGC
jgi:hypothetical protein